MSKVRFNMVVDKETDQRLDKLAEKHYRNKSNMIVYLINRAYEDEFGKES